MSNISYVYCPKCHNLTPIPTDIVATTIDITFRDNQVLGGRVIGGINCIYCASRGAYALLDGYYTLVLSEDCNWRTKSPHIKQGRVYYCLLYTSPSPRDRTRSRMPSSA